MSPSHQRRSSRALRRERIGCLARQVKFVLLAILALLVVLIVRSLQTTTTTLPDNAQTPTVAATRLPPIAEPTRRASQTPAVAPTLSPSPTHGKGRVGILAGHSGPQNDPGAVCPDGLREVDINLAVALRVVAELERRGYVVDLLEEYDDRIDGYVADAFLSIHSDSCEVPDATGFKVARVAASAIPEVEDALVQCLYEEYERVTQLTRHESSITPAMHGYYAFLKINPQTPGAIIELGFMAADRNILVNRPDRLAVGIVAGLLCFLER